MSGRITKEWFVDAVERVGMTFLEAAAGAFALDLMTEDEVVARTGEDLLTAGRGAAFAGLAAAAAAVKVIAGAFIGHRTSASWVPDDPGPGHPVAPFP